MAEQRPLFFVEALEELVNSVETFETESATVRQKDLDMPPLANEPAAGKRQRKQARKAPHTQPRQGPRPLATLVTAEQRLARRRQVADVIHIDIKAPPRWIESIGAARLFSVSDAEALWDVPGDHDHSRMRQAELREAMKLGNRRGLVVAPPPEALEPLRERFPNALPVLDAVARAFALSRLSADQGLAMPPLLIAGEPGIGKTAVLQAIARIAGTPFRRFDIAGMTTGAELLGLSSAWGNTRPGVLWNALSRSAVINPAYLCDEIDKAGAHRDMPLTPGLLSLLERETAAAWRDECIGLAMDVSRCLWFATANDLDAVPAPLLNRFDVVTMDRPTEAQGLLVAQSVYASLREANSWGRAFLPLLPDAAASALAPMVPREMARRLLEALGRAAIERRTTLHASDIVPATPPRRRIGF